MHYVIPWSDGIEGLVMCTVSCGDRVRYVLRGIPPLRLGYLQNPCTRTFVVGSIAWCVACRMFMVSLGSVWAWVSVG